MSKKKATAAVVVDPQLELIYITFDEIHIEQDFNVRKDMGDIPGLVASITAEGVRVPLRGNVHPDGGYTLTDGERRYNALKQVVLKQPTIRIPFLLEPEGYTEEERLLDMLLTGTGGKKLNMVEEAEVIVRLLERGWKRPKVADAIGKTSQHVANCELLLTAPDDLKSMVRQGVVSATILVETIRDKEGDMEAVRGDFMKAQEKAGENQKIKPRDMPTSKSNKPTLALLKDIREDLAEQAADMGNRANRLSTLDLTIGFLSGDITEGRFRADFYRSRKITDA